MIAGGTGITPMLQIINAILKDPNDSTKISLLFANQTEDDILLRDELDKLAKQHEDRFQIWYTLDKMAIGWKYSTGYITDEMIDAHLPKAGADTAILMCGPPPMINFACVPNLEKLQHAKENYFSF
ncbi:unnamed protein product [Anisakis simplex]|uniref:Cytochrome-b5 reductase n=1 Tax=Anisakis simplex TaxID=6269 RepID=A0A0M3IZY4_ANISI|nr:unnamed protein product [Anisakis simplex]